MSAWPEVVLGRPAAAALRVVGSGEEFALPVTRWHGPVLGEELAVLARMTGPVLDVGCGPGRHAAALRHFGHDALGIDTSPAAVRAARRRGARARRVSVFGPVPRSGQWASALLLDGNIGIGGDPVRLLRRVHDLLGPDGRAFVEVEGPGVGSRRFRARVHHATGSGSDFPWALVGAEGIDSIAEQAGYVTESTWGQSDRWFAELRRSVW